MNLERQPDSRAIILCITLMSVEAQIHTISQEFTQPPHNLTIVVKQRTA